MDFKELYMSFTKEGHVHTLWGLQTCLFEIVISHRMEKLLKKLHFDIITQYHIGYGKFDTRNPPRVVARPRITSSGP
jgi:hypothetical protein